MRHQSGATNSRDHDGTVIARGRPQSALLRVISRRRPKSQHCPGAQGHTLVELAAALSIAAVAAIGVVSGATSLRDAVSLLTGRQRVAGALEYARRESYRRGETAELRTDSNGRTLRVTIAGVSGREFTLQRSRVIDRPARGRVRFFASGLAENATFTIAAASGGEADIIVNQRGEIRWR